MLVEKTPDLVTLRADESRELSADLIGLRQHFVERDRLRCLAFGKDTRRVGTFTSQQWARSATNLRMGYGILSGNLTMNPSLFGIRTLGSVLAFMTSFSPMILLSARM